MDELSTCEICLALESDGEDPLERIRAARARRDHLAKDEEDAVLAARFAGHSWEQVAAALGTSRQAAWQRWSKSTPNGSAPDDSGEEP